MPWDRQSLRYRGGVIDAPGGGTPDGHSRIVLLVHGYNNDKADADEAYAALLKHVTADVGARAEDIWKFYWPGYVERLTGTLTDEPTTVSRRHDGSESNAVLSAPSYALQVLRARQVGAALGRYIGGLYRAATVPTEVVLIAHSLGCRVVLESLRELLQGRPPRAERHRVPAVCLMAAAVPTFMVEEGARLADAAMLPNMAFVLHSRADAVLRFAFPPGQSAASAILAASLTTPGGEGLFPEAVGRHGNPSAVFLRRGDTGLGHSEYWTHPFTAPAVLRALGGGGTQQWRSLPTLTQVSWSLPPASRLPDWKNRAAHPDVRRPLRI